MSGFRVDNRGGRRHWEIRRDLAEKWARIRREAAMESAEAEAMETGMIRERDPMAFFEKFRDAVMRAGPLVLDEPAGLIHEHSLVESVNYNLHPYEVDHVVLDDGSFAFIVGFQTQVRLMGNKNGTVIDVETREHDLDPRDSSFGFFSSAEAEAALAARKPMWCDVQWNREDLERDAQFRVLEDGTMEASLTGVVGKVEEHILHEAQESVDSSQRDDSLGDPEIWGEYLRQYNWALFAEWHSERHPEMWTEDEFGDLVPREGEEHLYPNY